jgi:thymidylate synthase (FAD)
MMMTDGLIGQVWPVLDDGFVKVVDLLGGDRSIVDAARGTVQGAKPLHEDRGLIRYLMRHWHTTPFEFAEIVLHVRVPMDTWRQWIRHRTASVNEYSTRYRPAIDSAYTTMMWRKQSTTNRQGSSEEIFEGDEAVLLCAEEEFIQRESRKTYDQRLEMGVAQELARKDLPLATYTEAYWKIDLHNLLHFLRLRMDAHAQWEIRQYASLIGNEIVAQWCPLVWEAFRDYRLDAIILSAPEIDYIKGFMMGGESQYTLSKREKEELTAKFKHIGMFHTVR